MVKNILKYHSSIPHNNVNCVSNVGSRQQVLDQGVTLKLIF